MKWQGTLEKLPAVHEDPVRYFFPGTDNQLCVNEMIGSDIKLRFDGVIHCISCGKRTRSAYGQGFCYDCFVSSPLNSECIIFPEKCRAHLGEGRDMVWEREFHLTEQVVYLSLSSQVKVGVTRANQVTTRWIDQGASHAILLARVPRRNLAGEIELSLKEHFSDKTNWRKMLTNQVPDDISLLDEKRMAITMMPSILREYLTDEDDVCEISYPVTSYPSKVVSLNFDKTPVIEGRLTGIKGQYLMFSDGRVINMRRFTGYNVAFTTK
jgi:hypothetical protein